MSNVPPKILQLQKFGFLLIASLCFHACQPTSVDSNKPFRLVSSQESGIDFKNTITETEDFNILNFHYIYNGGGVGVGDFDKNGLQDLVFSGNETTSKLYLNQGNLKFTVHSNFHTEGWVTGVSIVDINADGWDDIYLSLGGLNCDGTCKNQLYINQGLNQKGIPTFVEKAVEYGLDDGLYTQQTAFFDYDNDGDLDVYQLRNVIDPRDKNAPSKKKFINKKSTDQFLENTGSVTAQFIEQVDLTSSKNLANQSDGYKSVGRGYGLGITINDFNNDNLPDLYIANDFLSDDFMYLNKGNENQTGYDEVSKEILKHQSYNAMGVDVADLNGDALPEIFILDMMPDYHERQKTMIGFMNYDKFLMTLRQGYAPQFIRNTLQVHNGFLNGQLLPFSELGYMAGVYATDWSWAPLLADFDNDGDRDIYVTNGYGKDITDLDFINFSNQASGFGTKEAAQKQLFEAIQKMENVTVPNYFFENKGDLNFKNRTADWTNANPSISNGAVYVDLDNDGDLDIVTNNINEEAFILENRLAKANYLKLQLKGTPKNPSGIGSKIKIWADGKVQAHYQSPVRGYLSSVTPIAHFGLGENEKVDSLEIIWSNLSIQKLKNIEANQSLVLKIENAKSASDSDFPSPPELALFKETNLFDYTHKENHHQDYDAQPLLLHQHSRQGPCLAVANIDGQPGDEIFIGGAKGFPGKIFYESKNGKWRNTDLPDKEREDTGATFFDYDNDGDLDLYVVSGGSESLVNLKKGGGENLNDRVYLNDGHGNYSKTEIPNLPKTSGSCVVANDYDQSGDVNLFIGGRVSPRKFPKNPQSSLLVKFMDKTVDYANKLANPLNHNGMVSDAIWADFDNDKKTDLVTVGEWSTINFYKNKGGGHLALQTANRLLPTGLWNCIEAADFDNDGDLDFMVGNLGKNSRLHASVEEPMTLFTGDLDKNNSPDPFVAQYYQNKKGERKSYPIHARDDIAGQVVKLKKKYLKYAEFASATFTDLVGDDPKSRLEITNLQSSYIENLGDGNFEITPLPQSAQTAPIQDILAGDFDGDGIMDALLIGNDFTAEKNGGWHDAFNGLMLRGKGNGIFESIPTSKSGFLVEGDGRGLVKLKSRSGKRIIVAGQNSGKLKFFEY